jgi:hypothetical protein
MTDQNITTKNGWRHPLGATPDAGGEKCLGELVIKGPARLTALAKPCSLLGYEVLEMSKLRCGLMATS